MENLWPVEVLSDVSWADSPWGLIDAQVAALSQSTKGLVHCELRRRETPSGRSMFMFIFPTDQPMKGYEFMAIRSPEEEGFPLALEVYHLGEGHRIRQARNAGELRRALMKIFQDEATLRIIRLLAREVAPGESSDVEGRSSLQPQGDREDPEAAPSYPTASESARPFAVGGLIQDGSKSFATVHLLGIGGFLHEDELRRLVMKPDVKGSAVGTFNGRYIVTVSFLDSVKMTLTSGELKVLQNEVRNSLGCTAL